ncbi:hypothetical protein [Aliagarivorans marinus]|uniref:hypothetical protein n=1 Tax=Aliagarivorans marinus TaxID=561965 RepID=UPI00041FF6C0|nr:hypothetical protein [Aliagarivorans marinus]
MTKNKLAIAVLASAFAFGCASTSTEEQANLDRETTKLQLVERCDEIDGHLAHVSYAIDKVSNMFKSTQERQCKVLDEYRVLASEYADVVGFLDVNAGLNDEELRLAIAEFDQDKPEEEHIGPKVAAYQAAGDHIFQANIELTAQIALDVAELGIVAANNATDLAVETGIGTVTSLFKSDDEKSPLMQAWDDMNFRKELITDANTLIASDKATIDQLKELDQHIAGVSQ